MVVADVEHEGRRTVDRLGTQDPSARADGFDAVVTGTGLAAHDQRRAIGGVETAGHALAVPESTTCERASRMAVATCGWHHPFADIVGRWSGRVS